MYIPKRFKATTTSKIQMNKDIESGILKCIDDTIQELGMIYLESHYQTVLAYYLQKDGFTVMTEVPIVFKTSFGLQFGVGRLDIVCEKNGITTILELKSQINFSHSNIDKTCNQIQRYLEHYPVYCQYGMTILE